MTKKTIAKTASRKPVGIASLVLATTIRPICEDLAVLADRLAEAPAEAERLAGLRNATPTCTVFIARAAFHDDQLGRFVKMMAKDETLTEERVDTFNALNLLRQSSYLAAALIEPNSDDDRWAKEYIGECLASAAKRQGDPARAALLRTAFGLAPKARKKSSVADVGEMTAWIHETVRRMGLIRPPAADTSADELARAGCYRLEEAPSLEAFFAAAPDLTSLAEEAMDLLAKADTRTQSVGENDRVLEQAAKSALTLAYAAIARVGLWPARTERDLHAKATCRTILRNRVADPASARAVAAMAYDLGNGVAGQSDRFKVEPQHANERFPGQG
ncbi:hypothetical protein OCUBac02_14840 [Bosea sp. ANAM02]|nr:hypothetical protein OCUBac02_14840 [Bosea sp. ANAM02]